MCFCYQVPAKRDESFYTLTTNGDISDIKADKAPFNALGTICLELIVCCWRFDQQQAKWITSSRNSQQQLSLLITSERLLYQANSERGRLLLTERSVNFTCTHKQTNAWLLHFYPPTHTHTHTNTQENNFQYRQHKTTLLMLLLMLS